MMAIESIRTIRKIPKKTKVSDKIPLAHRLPLQMEFPHSKCSISVLMPIFIGGFVGVMASLLGVSGGFFLIPAMIYLLGMPTSLVIGTSLFQTIFISANVTILQAISTKTVDVVLAVILICGSVFGAQVGTRLGGKLPAEHLRAILAAIVLALSAKIALGLFTPPSNVYSVSLSDD